MARKKNNSTTETDSDIKEYVKEKETEYIKVELPKELKAAQSLLKFTIEDSMDKLKKYGIVVRNKGDLLDAQKRISRKIREENIAWRNLRDNGGESLRTNAKNCFYPIILRDGKIIDFGNVLDSKLHPKSQTVKKNGKYFVYPIDRKGIERKWRYARQSVEQIRHLLRVKKTGNGFEIEIGKDYGTVRTVWQDSKYDSNEYGTKLVHALVSNSHFDFPKSV